MAVKNTGLLVRKKILCPQKKTDCYANIHGRCELLTDTDFADDQCTFYKKVDEVDETTRRLIREGAK